jgi:hypothetical protein
MMIVQVGDRPLQAPDQPANLESRDGVAVNVTCVCGAK